jgi:tetratricopeptide (TPR) repeat protein
VLRLAAVLGREFALPALARLAAVSDEELLESLDEAMAARVVTDVPGASRRLRFAHVLVRDTLYESLTTAGRVRLHRQAVEALEVLYGEEPGSHLAELAFHSIAGSDFDRALAYSRSAGDRALALLAYEEAVRLYEAACEALDLTDAPDENARCELLLSLGEAKARAGSGSAAKETFLDAAALARRLNRPRELGRAALGYGGRISWARTAGDDRLVPLLEEGLASLPADEVELRARLLARLAGALRDEHSRERRDALTDEAVELARRTGSPVALAYALDGRAGAIIAPDTIEECLTLASELRDVAERIGDREQLIQGHDTCGLAHSMAGDMDRAAEHFEAARRVADELGQPDRVWQTLSTVAAMALAEGRLVEGETLAQKAFDMGEHAQPEMAIPVYQFQRFTIAEHRGTLAEVEPAIRALVADYPRRPVCRTVLAYVEARLERPRAKHSLDNLARDRFSALPFDQEWLFGMSFLAETAALLNAEAASVVLYDVLEPWGDFNAADAGEGIRGSISRYLGLLAASSGRLSVAERHFEAALEMNARMGVAPWLAYTQSDYARMLVERREPGDAERAEELLASAKALSAEIGLRSLDMSLSPLAR